MFAVNESGWIRLSPGTIPEQVLTWHGPTIEGILTPATEVRRTRQPMVVPDVNTWLPNTSDVVQSAAAAPTSAAALYPLLADDAVIGTLVVVVRQSHLLDRAAHTFLQATAASCAAALTRTRGSRPSSRDEPEAERAPMSEGPATQQQMSFDLVEDAPFGVYVVGADFRVVSMNRNSRDGAFRHVRPIIGRDFAEVLRILWPERVASDLIHRFQATLATGTPYVSRDFTSQRADIGTTESYEWELKRVALADGQHAVVCYYFDSTPERRVEQQMKRDLHAMSLMQELGNVCTRPGADRSACLKQALDAAIAITHANRGYCRLLDPATGQLLFAAQHGFDAAFLNEFHTITSNDDVAACAVALRERRRVVVTDLDANPDLAVSPTLRGLLAAGVRALVCTPLVASHGRVLGVITTHFAEPWEADERALQVLDLLARQVADYVERIEADDALKQADRRKDEFLATLSHELRNPLVPLKTGVQLLRAVRSNPEQLSRITDMMERQVGHMVRLVDDLLEVSRITRGSIDLRVEALDLRTLVSETIDTVGPSVDAGGHRLAVSVPSEPVRVCVDRVRMTQVFLNILNNAVKYTTRGGTISMSVEQDGPEAIVRVRDTGVGIRAELLPRIFDLFTQVDRSIGRPQGGLGIGLSLARHLVRMHDGRIEARSEGEGHGSEFLVVLPIADQGPRGASAESAVLPRVSAAQRVLVVDDNHDAADAFAMLLQAMGADVRTAYDGLAAISESSRWHPDVVFLDLGMPDMDGFAVAARLRLDPQLSDVALVALTGWGQRSIRQRTDEAGFDAHLVKPVDGDTLATLLDSLRQRSGRRAASSPPRDDHAPPA